MNMRYRILTIVVIVAIVLPVIPAFTAELSQPVYSVIEEMDVKVTMRDGVRLSTNIYRPDAEGAFPVLLVRTPYGNGVAGEKSRHYWAARGYVLIMQDTRGRYESEGVFYPAIYEAADGLDTQKWISEQPWCNGKIGTWGGSYVGMTQWMPALEGSPYLNALFTTVPFTEIYTVVFQNGALRRRLFSEWYSMMTAPYGIDEDAYKKNDIDRMDRTLPVVEQDKEAGWRMPYFRDVVGHPERDLFWKPVEFEGKYKNIHAPVYILAGWFDLFTGQNLKNFVELQKSAAGTNLKGTHRIIVGPWGHGVSADGKVGDMDFGKESTFDATQMMLRWFDYHLKGIDTGVKNEPPVKIFVMGDNVWRNENEWPLARAKTTRYYFHSGGKANTKGGDGFLSLKTPAEELPDTFLYNPDDPVPSQPDGTTFSDFRNYPVDHSNLEDRKDILVFSTPFLTEETEVTGPVSVVLYASSTAKNTDFTAKLLDVYPDGKAIYLCDGIIRTSFRNGPVNTTNIEPGKVYAYTIDCWATSNVFKKGHRIRVEISSSNFPRFDRNLNTGRDFATETEWEEATQTVYHDSRYPSCLVLPIIPRK